MARCFIPGPAKKCGHNRSGGRNELTERAGDRRVALIRSLTHELGNHDTGSHYLLTGHRPAPAVQYPSLGSIIARETGVTRALPPYIAIPEAVPAAGSGYLPGAYSPFAIGGDPSRPDYKVRDLEPPASVGFDRVERRRTMQQALDDFARDVEKSPSTVSLLETTLVVMMGEFG